MNRISKSSIDWAKIYQKMGPSMAATYKDMKSRHDDLLLKIGLLPSDKLKIDWEHYRKIIPVAGLVDKLKTEYESYKIPEPKDKDNWNEKLKLLEEELKKEITKSKEIDDTVIEFSNEFLKNINTILPKPNECSWELIHAFYPEKTVHEKEVPPHAPNIKRVQDAVAEVMNAPKKPFFRYE